MSEVLPGGIYSTVSHAHSDIVVFVPLVVHRSFVRDFAQRYGASLALARRLGVLWVVFVPYEVGLLLARVDGKSPVEYLHDEAQKARVREVARALLESAPLRLAAVRSQWQGS